MTPGAPVIMVGLDAAELDLVDRLAGEGLMPNLARLRAAGRQGVLRPSPPAFLSMVWPEPRQRRAGDGARLVLRQGLEPGPDAARACRAGLAAAAAVLGPDRGGGRARRGGRRAVRPGPGRRRLPGRVPERLAVPRRRRPRLHPPGLRRELRARFGRPALGPELFGPQTPAGLARLAREMAASARQAGEAAAWLLGRERFDLFLLVLGATHRGGHYLWDLSQVERQGIGPDERRGLEGALRRIHAAADEALGRVLAAAPPGARVLAFALHGMAPNDGWADRFPALVDLVRGGGTCASACTPPTAPTPTPRPSPATACGCSAHERMLLRFVDGRPVSPVTCAFLAWAAEQLATEGVGVLAAGLGQRLLARQPGGPRLGPGPRPSGQGRRRRVPPPGLPLAEPQPVSEPDRAQVGPRQAGGGRAGAQARRGRAEAALMRALPCAAPPASRTAGCLKMH